MSRWLLMFMCLTALLSPGCGAAELTLEPQQNGVDPPKIPKYERRHGRARPVVAVIGENTFTELTDYVVPYSVLTESGVAEVVAVATKAGPIQMFPALKLQPQATSEEFDKQYPAGADYVIVPAVHRTDDPLLLRWIQAQASKGATIVGVCDGVWVLANAGLLEGRTATGHWYSFADLQRKFPGTRWVRDLRYVADGSIVTTTGVTASIPVSLALVEAIAGHGKAQELAVSLGVSGWSPAHNSEAFRLTSAHIFTAATNWLARWSHERIGISVPPGVDELSLALQADALSRTYKSEAFSVSADAAPIRTQRGLLLVPDMTEAMSSHVDRLIPPRGGPMPAKALDDTLVDIERAFGKATAAFVALQLEYPQP